jgi:CRISPR type IV-associated protein Csf2
MYKAEDGKFTNVPFFSANGYRGILRRNLTAEIFDALEQKDGNKVDLASIHLYASGGGTSTEGLSGLNYVEKQECRVANPYLSVFGAGLSDIDGKLAVSDIVPVGKSKDTLGHLYGVRFDESERSSILTPFIDKDSVIEYMKELDKKRAASTKLRKLEKELSEKRNEKDSVDTPSEELLKSIEELEGQIILEKEEKGMSYQQVYKADFIRPDTLMSSSIATRAGHEFTDVEKGMVLYGLIKTSQQQIGSYARIGWGVCDWEVKNSDSEILFKTVSDPKYILQRTVFISEKGKEILKPFKDWLGKIGREDLFFIG